MIVLHWQLLHWFKRLSLAARVGIFSCLGHLFVLFALFVVYKGNGVYNVIISSTMINTDAKIVYMPLHRSIKQSAQKSTCARASSLKSSSSAAPKAQTKIDNGPSTTIITRKNPKPVAASKKKNKEEKIKAKKATSKIVESKKIVEKKEIPKAEVAKPEVKPKDVEPIKPAQEIKEAQKVETQTNATSENSVATNVDQNVENVVYVGQAEMEALQLQEFIQNEMAAHWTPPAGIRSDAQCVVKIIVSHDGQNNQIVLEQPSKILLFDSAARRAAAQLQPPSWAYGKEILITFKP